MSRFDLDDPDDPSARAVRGLLTVPEVADELGERFEAAGHQLHMVGGSVRDALLDRTAPPDLDFATDARPEQVLALASGWADSVWDIGIAFGTVGLSRAGQRLEVTTYRSESYDRSSRNPDVTYGDTLEGDLVRRDFTINAMAVGVPRHEFVDLFGGLADLGRRVLRTPAAPEDSFDDDPLRILRAARFVAQLSLEPDKALVEAMRSRAPRIAIVAPERVRDELVKLLMAPDPVPGLELMVQTGVADVVLPELPVLRMEIDVEHPHKDVYDHTLAVLRNVNALEPDRFGAPDLITRLAAVMHDVGKPRTRAHLPGGGVSFHHHEVVGASITRKRLTALRFPKSVVEDVSRLVELHLRFFGYGRGEWTDSAVRRYAHDAGPLLDRLHVLVRSDSTTRNKRKAAGLARTYDALERRIAELAEREEMERVRPDLDGHAIGRILGIKPGPQLGQAYKHLLALRLEHGPLGAQEAERRLLEWAAEQGVKPDAAET